MSNASAFRCHDGLLVLYAGARCAVQGREQLPCLQIGTVVRSAQLARFLGEDRPMRFVDPEKQGFFNGKGQCA